MNFVVVLLYLISFTLIYQFVGYPLLMGLIASRSNSESKDYSCKHFISIIVPTYNEEKVIKSRIENLLNLSYPKNKYEILVVDSGSTDDTVKIFDDLMKKYNFPFPHIKLVEEVERMGKASAINFGKKYAEGEIILVTDANSIFDKNVLTEIIPHFKNQDVGAVGGRYCVSNPENPLALSESFYWDLEYIMRRGESALDSACLFHGEINAWRKNIVDADTKMLSEDLDMCIQIRRKGYKIKYEPNALVYEPSATTPNDQIKQRKRTSIGTIQNIFKHFDYFLLPRNFYSLLIFPSHKILTMLSPFNIIAIPILYHLTWDIKVISLHVLMTISIFIVLFAILMILKARLIKNRTNKPNISLPRIVNYVLLNEFLIFSAWIDFIFSRYSVLWEKVESSR